MGLRFRKSINLGGGFRVNLSKSGVGYSWGTKGYRVTKTARGTTKHTVSIPGTGISYSSKTGKNHDNRKYNSVAKGAPLSYKDSSDRVVTDVKMVDTSNVDTMRPAEYADLFAATKRITTWYLVILLCTCLCLLFNPIIGFLFVIVDIWYISTQHVDLDYDFDDYALEKWNIQNTAWQSLASCRKLWYITLTATTNAKTNAGVTSGADIAEAKICKKLPWFLKTDLKPLIIRTKKQYFAFMPDRILVISGAQIGAVKYKDVRFTFGIQPFAGDIAAPAETEIMEYRWIKMNKNGTPDKRFKGNRKIPVYKLGALYLNSDSGLNIKILASRVEPIETIEKQML